jgi:hypothetical protein
LSYIHIQLKKKDKDGTSMEALNDFAHLIEGKILELGGFVTAISETNALSIDNKFKIVMSGDENYQQYVNVSALTYENTPLFSGRFRVCSGLGKDYGYACGIKAALNSNSFALTLRADKMFPIVGGAEVESPNFDMNFFYSRTSNNGAIFGCTGYNTNSTSTTRNFAFDTQMFNISGEQVFTAPSRLPYIAKSDITEIDVIENKIIVQNGIKNGAIAQSFDTSTITGDMFYPVGNKVYYAVNSNTLMEV